MKINGITALLAAALLGGGLAAPASAKAPQQMVLAADSPNALVVLRTDWWQPAPSMRSAFKLNLSTYADEYAKLTSNMFNGNVMIEARQSNFVEGYLIAAIKPGRWVFQSYSQQDSWALCFNAGSLQFEVKPGEVLYLGQFDALAHRAQLTFEAVNSGQTRVRGNGFVDFFDLPTGPKFAPVDPAQLDALRETLARRVPGVTAPVRPVAFKPARFGTGSTLYGQRKCGGYFNTSAKPRGGE